MKTDLTGFKVFEGYTNDAGRELFSVTGSGYIKEIIIAQSSGYIYRPILLEIDGFRFNYGNTNSASYGAPIKVNDISFKENFKLISPTYHNGFHYWGLYKVEE